MPGEPEGLRVEVALPLNRTTDPPQIRTTARVARPPVRPQLATMADTTTAMGWARLLTSDSPDESEKNDETSYDDDDDALGAGNDDGDDNDVGDDHSDCDSVQDLEYNKRDYCKDEGKKISRIKNESAKVAAFNDGEECRKIASMGNVPCINIMRIDDEQEDNKSEGGDEEKVNKDMSTRKEEKTNMGFRFNGTSDTDIMVEQYRAGSCIKMPIVSTPSKALADNLELKTIEHLAETNTIDTLICNNFQDIEKRRAYKISAESECDYIDSREVEFEEESVPDHELKDSGVIQQSNLESNQTVRSLNCRILQKWKTICSKNKQELSAISSANLEQPVGRPPESNSHEDAQPKPNQRRGQELQRQNNSQPNPANQRELELRRDAFVGEPHIPLPFPNLRAPRQEQEVFGEVSERKNRPRFPFSKVDHSPIQLQAVRTRRRSGTSFPFTMVLCLTNITYLSVYGPLSFYLIFTKSESSFGFESSSINVFCHLMLVKGIIDSFIYLVAAQV